MQTCLLRAWLCSCTHACDFAHLTHCCKVMMFCKEQCCQVLQGQVACSLWKPFSQHATWPGKHSRSTKGLPKGAHLGKAATTLPVKQMGGYVSGVTFTEVCWEEYIDSSWRPPSDTPRPTMFQRRTAGTAPTLYSVRARMNAQGHSVTCVKEQLSARSLRRAIWLENRMSCTPADSCAIRAWASTFS